MSLARGAIFAGYTVVRLLGSDATGEVYLVDHPRLARRNALRILPESAVSAPEFRERFIREAAAAATLHHPHIVEVHDYGEFDGRLWMAMDYVDGTDVARLIADQFPAGLPAGQALAIVTAVAEALDYAHQRGVLHGDVKPANIVLTRPESGDWRIMLGGFGVGQKFGAGSATATNLTLDTVGCTAPEQLIGAAVDPRADQYALAATAFQLLTGAPPFVGDNPVAVISQHLSAPPPKLADRRPDLAQLDEVMSAALAKDPADRFGCCAEFADALSRHVAVGTLSPEAALTRAEPWPAEPRMPESGGPVAFIRRRRWIIGGSLLAVVAILAAAVLVADIVRQRGSHATSAAPGAGEPSVPAPPPTTASSAPAEPPQLDGTFQVDVNRSRQTYNDVANPQPPDVTTWWAFRSACLPTGCVATRIKLDDDRQNATPGDFGLTFDFVDGRWVSRPQPVRFPCVDANGHAGMQTTTESLSLQRPDHGPLRGEMTVTVETNECGQQDAVIRVPTVAVRVGDVPPGVAVPDPAAPPAPTPTR